MIVKFAFILFAIFVLLGSYRYADRKIIEAERQCIEALSHMNSILREYSKKPESE